MSPANAKRPASKLRNFFRGLGEVGAFVGDCALAVFEVCVGRWPQAVGERRRPKAKPPNEGMGPIEKVLPFPTED
ncbi:MAG TPA: hypothetical protein VGH86_14775 [Phenylobacterium sp.]|jgi:hypothetical protein